MKSVHKQKFMHYQFEIFKNRNLFVSKVYFSDGEYLKTLGTSNDKVELIEASMRYIINFL